MKKILLTDLIPFDIFLGHQPIQIDLVYAQKNHQRNIFNEKLYKNGAKIWAHRDLAAITLLTANKLNNDFGYVMEIQDCLRTVEAQEKMQETEIVKQHPEWMVEPRLLAPPGAGGHPRGMAIDVRLLDKNKNEVDMGTKFDHMDQLSHRNCINFPDKILKNRKILEDYFVQSAKKLGHDFLPLPTEWWDFRFPQHIYTQYAPLSDRELPSQMQMTMGSENGIENLPQEHFDNLANNILKIVNDNL